MSILLVDDDVEFLKALTKVLEKEGYGVTPLPSATAAMQYVNTTKQRFDLLITDVSMPGMKGTAFAAVFKAAYPKTPIIVITAFGDWGPYMEALQNGAFDYLSKPLDKAEMLDCIKRALNGGPSRLSQLNGVS